MEGRENVLRENLKRLKNELGRNMVAQHSRGTGGDPSTELAFLEPGGFFSPANLDTNLLLEQKMHEMLRLKRLEEVC